MSKTRILFIGSFIKVNKDGGTGGQLFACTSLMTSDLGEKYEWVLIDSSTVLPIPGISNRIFKAFRRVTKSIYHILFSRIDVLLVFSADGLSIVEKGIICLIGKGLGKKVILAPRSGFLLNDLKKKRLKSFIGYIFKKIDFVICQGQNWKDVFISHFNKVSKEKFVVILNWIDTKNYETAPKKVKKKVNVLYLGWIEKVKGIEDLIMAIVTIKHLDFVVNIGGNGSYFDEGTKLVEEFGISDKVNFLGWVGHDEKVKQLAENDIFVLPSHFEGMPNAILEAMASGLPIIATKVGGIPDVVNKDIGILTNPKNIEELACALSTMIQDQKLRQEMGENALKRIRTYHSIDVASLKFKSIIEDNGF